MRPARHAVGDAIGKLLGDADSERLREQLINYVFGLCVFQSFGAEVLVRVGCKPPDRDAEIDTLLDTLHPFVLAGIARFASQDQEQPSASKTPRRAPPESSA